MVVTFESASNNCRTRALNVWLVRGHSTTSYRGGASQTLKDEFAAYGLPGFAFYVVGALPVLEAAALVALR